MKLSALDNKLNNSESKIIQTNFTDHDGGT